ncbi:MULTISPECIES: sensor histidine kinase [unclassified Anabaena]|uniref:sensor histidine kinase n=1 Tax=unclassified Anabaena TaxID=2619674 RepID=UPI000833C14F|nr:MULTISPECIES: ATP-binding protein [unclassified Anabaena]
MIDVIPDKFKKNCLRLFNGFSHNWSITKKIAYSYTIVIGTTVIGIVSGSLIAYSYEFSAYKKLNLSYQQQYLLKNLENAVNRARLHPQRLVPVIDDSVWLEFEKNRFLSDINYINNQLIAIEDFIKQHPDDLALDYQVFQSFLKKYRDKIEIYSQDIKFFWQEIATNESNDLPLSQLLSLLKEKETININIEFEKQSDELIQIIVHAEKQQQRANKSFNDARILRVKLVSISILLSTAIAMIIALLTSRLIALPLQSVTKIARKITQESNFQLRANINSRDEIGTLANSLNQLVEWVGEYTKALEIARQTLEQRVEERTQELQQAQRTLEQRVEERTQELTIALKELQQTQAQLIQTEKMSSLGQMVAGIAHEINNPVNFINGNIECADEYIKDLLDLINLYQQQYPHPDDIIADTIEEIELSFISKDLVNILVSMKMGVQRIREIVLSLRNFSRLDEADMKEVDIHEGIDNTLLILNHRIKSGIAVIKNYGNLPLIECYPAQLNQVFMNIISNAIDALLAQKTQNNPQIIISTDQVDDNHIKVEITDNGAGITPENIQKIFDPFFTTKPVGKGTGLGLSVCYTIIEKHQGKIAVFSEVNQGSKFVISLPIYPKYL